MVESFAAAVPLFVAGRLGQRALLARGGDAQLGGDLRGEKIWMKTSECVMEEPIPDMFCKETGCPTSPYRLNSDKTLCRRCMAYRFVKMPEDRGFAV
jgi:hypothetical protein